jgi:hypothetical protein
MRTHITVQKQSAQDLLLPFISISHVAVVMLQDRFTVPNQTFFLEALGGGVHLLCSYNYHSSHQIWITSLSQVPSRSIKMWEYTVRGLLVNNFLSSTLFVFHLFLHAPKVYHGSIVYIYAAILWRGFIESEAREIF